MEDVKAALAEVKDMIARRTTIADDGTAHDSVASGELNVVRFQEKKS